MSKDFDEMMKTYTERYSKICIDNNQIDASLFDEFGVKRGLRDKNGKGVLSGITNISLIKSSTEKDGKTIPCDGQLYYRGYNIFDLTQGFRNEKRFGFSIKRKRGSAELELYEYAFSLGKYKDVDKKYVGKELPGWRMKKE